MNADEMCGDYPAPCNCDDPETHDGAVTTADRPSVTAAARAEADRRYIESPLAPENEALADAFIEGAEWAAGRAETTTATDEDMFEQAWEVIVRVRDAHPRTVDDAPTEDIVDALIDARLLATARTRPTREQVTAAIGDAANSMQVGFGVVSITAAVDAVLALLNEEADRG